MVSCGFDLRWHGVFSTGCRGTENVRLVEAAVCVRYVVGIEEGQTQFISQGVVGSTARRCNLAGKGLGYW